MNEHLDNAWKEFERTGEICNSAEQLLNLAGDLTEQNKLLREALGCILKIAEFPPVDKLILNETRKALEATK